MGNGKSYRMGIFMMAVLVISVMFGMNEVAGQGQPPPGLRQIQVRPMVFTPAEVLRPGTYTVWVRDGEYPPGVESDSNRVTPYRGGVWRTYTNILLSPGGKPRHVTIFRQIGDPFGFKDFDNPQYGTPGPNEFLLHIDNQSLKDTVTYVFQLTGVTGDGSSHSVRFTRDKDGVISDRVTGLQWYVGPDQDTNWNQAKSWTENLTAGGGGWRMPTIPELKALYQKGAGRNNIDPIFQTTVTGYGQGR